MGTGYNERAQEFYDFGQKAFEEKHYRDAVNEYSRAIKINPQVAAGFVARANAYMMLNNRPKAIIDLNEALKYEPDNPDLLFLRGEAYSKQIQYPEAIEDLTRCIELKPLDLNAHVVLARSLSEYGDINQAITITKTAYESIPDAKSTLSPSLCLFHIVKQDFETAIEYAEIALTYTPEHPLILDLLPKLKLLRDRKLQELL